MLLKIKNALQNGASALVHVDNGSSHHPRPSVDPNGNSIIHQSIAAQVAHLGVNETFDVTASHDDNGQKISFARLHKPPVMPPPREGSSQAAAGSVEAELHNMRQVLAALLAGMEETKATYAHVPPGAMHVDGMPCMLKRLPEGGYEIWKFVAGGKLEFVCHLSADSL